MIKASVDRDPRPGRFLLTGSARVLALADLPDALVGRMQAVELWPLSQGENFRGLMHLRDRPGERFLAGFVLHLGTASRAFGDRLRALPAAALWTAAAP